MRGYWSIEYSIEPNESDLDHITEMIKQGFLGGEIVQESWDEAVEELTD